ncbi:MAG: ribosomal protein L7/L12 [Ardenticatenaceae bacterium]|nr:ribosomal protein L7/L12 [Ardenticatenaceae bacterium]
MTQSFECPNCQATLDYNPQSNPVTVRCSFCNSTVIVPESLRPQSGPRNQQSSLAEIVGMVQNGRKIEAIKLFRETFGVGLKEAKDVVDAIDRHEDIHLGGTSFHTGGMTVTSYTSTPTVQTSGGRGGCALFIAILVIIAIGAAGVLFFIPFGSETLVEDIRNVTEPLTESNSDSTFVQPEIPDIAATLESVLPQQAIEANDSGFASVVLEIGGEEGTGPGFFNDTRRLGMDGQGNIYTGDYSGGRIQVFDASGKFLATWNAGEDLYMTGMTADRNGTVYILKSSGVGKYNGLTGEFLGTVSLPGSQTRFMTATTGPDGSVYLISDDRLVRLDNSGNLALDVAEPFANVPDFYAPYDDAAVDGAGNIYVLGKETIYKLNPQGQFIDQIGSLGEGEDQFYTSPTAIAVDGKGRIFANDFWGIKVFEGTAVT